MRILGQPRLPKRQRSLRPRTPGPGNQRGQVMPPHRRVLIAGKLVEAVGKQLPSNSAPDSLGKRKNKPSLGLFLALDLRRFHCVINGE